ncbi:unnamed protein product [Calypogeia fissa]
MVSISVMKGEDSIARNFVLRGFGLDKSRCEAAEMDRFLLDFFCVDGVVQQQSHLEDGKDSNSNRRHSRMVPSSPYSVSKILRNLWGTTVLRFKRVYCQSYRALLLRNSKMTHRRIQAWDPQDKHVVELHQ